MATNFTTPAHARTLCSTARLLCTLLGVTLQRSIRAYVVHDETGARVGYSAAVVHENTIVAGGPVVDAATEGPAIEALLARLDLPAGSYTVTPC